MLFMELPSYGREHHTYTTFGFLFIILSFFALNNDYVAVSLA